MKQDWGETTMVEVPMKEVLEKIAKEPHHREVGKIIITYHFKDCRITEFYNAKHKRTVYLRQFCDGEE